MARVSDVAEAADLAAPASARAVRAAIAVHRFGLGEATLDLPGADPAAWLRAQIGPADAQRGDQLAGLADGLRVHAAVQRARQMRRAAAAASPTASAAAAPTVDMADRYRDVEQADLRAQLSTAAATRRPFAERMALFWTNHFTVSQAKAGVRALAGAFEREAIRPHIAGDFEILLKAAVTHGAMLRYLDNDQSAGPDSPFAVRRRRRPPADGQPLREIGLNENLAREVLELHTLGAASHAYMQADVTALAAVLTGWRLPVRPAAAAGAEPEITEVRFDPTWHQPGPKQLLGKTYAEGPQALDAVLHDLAHHPATARFIALKLARHVVADEPPPALVDRLAQAFVSSGGHLPAVYGALIDAPQAWAPAPAKLKTPAEFIVSTCRLLGLDDPFFARPADGGSAALGQRLQAAPSPAGWSDRAADWLGPDAVWKRVEWAARTADRWGRQHDARALARAAFGPLLSTQTARQIDRAADGAQAMTLLLMSPEFQRR